LFYNFCVRKSYIRIWIIPAIVVLGLGIYYIPPVHSRLSWRLDNLRGQIKYFFNPPAQAVFQPTQQVDITAIYGTTRAQYMSTLTPRPSSTPRSGPTSRPTVTPTTLPAVVDLPGVIYVDQHGGWNYCAPANLTMALKFWGWKGTRDDVIKVVKPGENDPKKSFIDRGLTDKNVMPYELVDFVNEHTEYKALYRYGGDIQLIKSLVAGGFPMVAEKGIYETDTTGKTSWMGHYLFVTGYDEGNQTLLTQDSYMKGPNYHITYREFLQGWRSFNNVFYIVYPADREADVENLMALYMDPMWAAGHALEMADQDIQSQTGVEQFFAWFAKGTSHVALQQYVDAAYAYDQAFSVYASLKPDYSTRPWRMMWYQTGPYFAYFYAGRYQDVIDLANFTLDKTSGMPTLEESLYWRAMAEYAIGEIDKAQDDMRRSVYYNQNFKAGLIKLQEWGVQP
jgi:hypothetical protein